MTVFRSLVDAIKAGYEVYDRTDTGYLVRTRTSGGWALALVALVDGPYADGSSWYSGIAS
jgi:hypothetical protein